MAERKWRFAFWPVLAFACALPALLALGSWQVRRGMEKQLAYDAFARAAHSEPRNVTGLSLAAFNALPRHERVRLHGHYVSGRQFLLDNMPRDGRPGHHVLAAFEPLGAGYVVMVDRGWRPGMAQDAAPLGEVAGSIMVVDGMLAQFPQPALQLDGKVRNEGWPRIVHFPEAAELGNALGQDVAASLLLLDENATDGFERDWSPPGIPPARHYAYAFQWYALAVALIVIFVLMARRRRTED